MSLLVCASPQVWKRLQLCFGMLGYYSYLECQVFHLQKETGFPKQVDMLPGYTRISRGVMERLQLCFGMLGYHSYFERKVFHLPKETGFPKQVDMLPGYTRIITCWWRCHNCQCWVGTELQPWYIDCSGYQRSNRTGMT
jgi:hypothetical protein